MTNSISRTSQRTRLLMFLLLFTAISRLAFAQELITNGSLTGTPASNTVPSGWTIVNATTSLNSVAGSNSGSSVVPWTGTPVASPDGGTFETVFYNPTFPPGTTFGTTVTGLIIGKTYTFSYYWAFTPDQSNAYPKPEDPARPVVTITGLSGYTQVATNSGTAFNWIKVTQTLTATAATATINFKAFSDYSYPSESTVSFDGISLKSACSAGSVAPVPSASTLVACGATANLTALQSGTPPSGSAFRWHTGTPGTTANAVNTPTTAAAPGTYYLTYFDATNDCYSPTSTAVTVTSTSVATPAITAVNPTCTVPTGGISVTSPVAGITYTLSPGGTTNTTGSFTGLAAGSGPYTVTASNGTCTSGVSNSISIAAAPNCVAADLTITLDIDALSFPAAGTSKDFVVNLYEIKGTNATNPIVLRINKLAGFTITYPAASGNSNVFGGTPNENSNWTITENASFITVTAKAGVVIPALGQAVVGFNITRKAGVAAGTTQNIAATISAGSAGEVNVSNNAVITSVTATPN